MTVNKLLLALLFSLGLGLAWLEASNVFAAAAPPAQAAAPDATDTSDAGIRARLVAIAGDERLSRIASAEGIMGREGFRGIDNVCMEALTRRADQIRRQPAMAQQSSAMPTGANDTCHVVDNQHLVGLSPADFRGSSHPPVYARSYRVLDVPGAVWMNYDVRHACAAYIDPERLNLEADQRGSYTRMWCG